jgi:AraC family transcriptional regulator
MKTPSTWPTKDSTPAEGAFGERIAKAFHLDKAPTLTTTRLKMAQLAVTRVASPLHGVGKTSLMPPERAYLVNLQLRDVADAELWKGKTLVARGPMQEGSIGIYHLDDEPRLNLMSPFDSLLFYVPEIVLDELADDNCAPRVSGILPQDSVPDPIMYQLGRVLLPALESPQVVGNLYFDHLVLAIFSHLASQYGEFRKGPPTSNGGLSSWQERLAKELLSADLAEELSIAEIAKACSLPESRFVRAFRQTTGAPPYRWLRGFRVEKAKELLFNSALSLAQVAYECGFADQSHFTRVFSDAIGTTPGAWRRSRRGGRIRSSNAATEYSLQA